jgi:outer membrane protein OmpA-like peptidoglycan-associated protein
MKKIYLLPIVAVLASVGAKAQELPANPAPGKCYIKCITKDEFKELTETITVAPAYKKLKVVPATFKIVDEKVLVKEAGKAASVIPTTYKTEEEKVLVKEASKKMVEVPATFKTVEEKILVSDESKKYVTYPAVYKTVTEKVLSKEASKKLVFVPATFKTVEEKILAKEATKRLSIVPQTFKTTTVPYTAKTANTTIQVVPASFTKESKTVVVKEKSGKWEYKVLADCPSANKEDCMTACYVETPEEIETITITKLAADAATKTVNCDNATSPELCTKEASFKKLIIDNPGSVKETEVPAVYTTIKKQVLATPARYDEVEVPAVYTTITKQVLVTPARVEETVIPAKYSMVKKQVVDTPAKMQEIEIPAEYAMVKKQVVDVAAAAKSSEIPAEYAIIKKQVIDVPASTVEEVVPAITKTVSKVELVKKGGITLWEEVDCSLVDKNIVLPILYETSSAKLTKESVKIIDDNLLKLMNEKPNLRIGIMSHTDSRGNDDYNLSLSQQRAQSVVNYLVSKGISRNRLEAKGYGETRLTNKCSNGVSCADEQHQANRRTEFKLLNN